MLSYLDSLPWLVKIPVIVAAVGIYVAFVFFTVQFFAFNDRPVKKTPRSKMLTPLPDNTN